VLAACSGTVLGALAWYGIGRLVNEERIEHGSIDHGRWIRCWLREFAPQPRWFSRHWGHRPGVLGPAGTRHGVATLNFRASGHPK